MVAAMSLSAEFLAPSTVTLPVISCTQIKSPDLRGGAALVMAGLVADGVTTVSSIHHIERGYEGFVSKLVSLGAKAERDTVPDEEDAIRD